MIMLRNKLNMIKEISDAVNSQQRAIIDSTSMVKCRHIGVKIITLINML